MPKFHAKGVVLSLNLFLEGCFGLLNTNKKAMGFDRSTDFLKTSSKYWPNVGQLHLVQTTLHTRNHMNIKMHIPVHQCIN